MDIAVELSMGRALMIDNNSSAVLGGEQSSRAHYGGTTDDDSSRTQRNRLLYSRQVATTSWGGSQETNTKYEYLLIKIVSYPRFGRDIVSVPAMLFDSHTGVEEHVMIAYLYSISNFVSVFC
jgi:hypothetical protein